jgi:phosphatidate cytidylyltransferase
MSSTRVLTSIVLIPVIFVVVWLLPYPYFMGLVVLATLVGLHEFYLMAEARGAKPLSKLGMALGALLIIIDIYGAKRFDWGPAFYITFCVITILTARLFSARQVEGALSDVAITLTGIFYVALLFGFQVAIHREYQGKYWLVFLYLIIWASDTGAYYIGTAFGKHRLYEKISPKKSIEGLIGGVLASTLVAILCKLWLVPSLGIIEAVVLGAVLALVGTVGDLVESLIKRSTGVKDSGTIIPGHGGILDRMDSMMFAAPVLYYYLQ